MNQATGKRKTAVASLRVTDKVDSIIVNGKPLYSYFSQEKHRIKALSPMVGTDIKITGYIKVTGGGVSSQSEAIRHSISRFIRNIHGANEELIKKLKKQGFLTRDSRKKERKKPGQEGARRNFQSQKR